MVLSSTSESPILLILSSFSSIKVFFHFHEFFHALQESPSFATWFMIRLLIIEDIYDYMIM